MGVQPTRSVNLRLARQEAAATRGSPAMHQGDSPTWPVTEFHSLLLKVFATSRALASVPGMHVKHLQHQNVLRLRALCLMLALCPPNACSQVPCMFEEINVQAAAVATVLCLRGPR